MQECVVSTGQEVAASVWEKGHPFTVYYRVDRIESDRLYMEVSEDWGNDLGRISAGALGHAYPYPLGIPIQKSQGSFHGATVSYSIEFIEVQTLASAPDVDTCRVSYPAGEAPPTSSQPNGQVT